MNLVNHHLLGDLIKDAIEFWAAHFRLAGEIIQFVGFRGRGPLGGGGRVINEIDDARFLSDGTSAFLAIS